MKKLNFKNITTSSVVSFSIFEKFKLKKKNTDRTHVVAQHNNNSNNNNNYDNNNNNINSLDFAAVR